MLRHYNHKSPRSPQPFRQSPMSSRRGTCHRPAPSHRRPKIIYIKFKEVLHWYKTRGEADTKTENQTKNPMHAMSALFARSTVKTPVRIINTNSTHNPKKEEREESKRGEQKKRGAKVDTDPISRSLSYKRPMEILTQHIPYVLHFISRKILQKGNHR